MRKIIFGLVLFLFFGNFGFAGFTIKKEIKENTFGLNYKTYIIENSNRFNYFKTKIFDNGGFSIYNGEQIKITNNKGITIKTANIEKKDIYDLDVTNDGKYFIFTHKNKLFINNKI